jgi:hypothetical protein
MGDWGGYGADAELGLGSRLLRLSEEMVPLKTILVSIEQTMFFSLRVCRSAHFCPAQSGPKIKQ